uniref:Uncharacterized protein n=1 Tax=Timema poppense TaxID=170557 RepID=A0A7R9D1W7_TIMPO|nr:unnamed protein product [Timema poppensis]
MSHLQAVPGGVDLGGRYCCTQVPNAIEVNNTNANVQQINNGIYKSEDLLYSFLAPYDEVLGRSQESEVSLGLLSKSRENLSLTVAVILYRTCLLPVRLRKITAEELSVVLRVRCRLEILKLDINRLGLQENSRFCWTEPENRSLSAISLGSRLYGIWMKSSSAPTHLSLLSGVEFVCDSWSENKK